MTAPIHTPEEYARALKLLLPPGRLDSSPGSLLHQLLLACADGLSRLDARVSALIEESDPRTASELLPEHESELGLPSTGSETDRQQRIASHLTARVRFRPVDLRNALAAVLGLDPIEVQVIETSRATAILMENDQEIYRFFVYRDPLLPGTYSLDDAQIQLDLLSHSHTKGHVIESIDFQCDDPFSLCDRDILGV